MIFGSPDHGDHSIARSSDKGGMFVPPVTTQRSTSWSENSTGKRTSSGRRRRRKKYYTRPVFKEPGTKIEINEVEEKVNEKMPSHRMEIIHGLRNEVGKILSPKSHVDTIQPTSRTKERLRTIMMGSTRRIGLEKERNLSSRFIPQTSESKLDEWHFRNSVLDSRDEEDSQISISSEVFDHMRDVGQRKEVLVALAHNAEASETSYSRSKSVWSVCDCVLGGV